MNKIIIVSLLAFGLLMSSCVSKKKFKALESDFTISEKSLSEANVKLKQCEIDSKKLQECEIDNEKNRNKIAQLEEQNAFIVKNQQSSIKQIESLIGLSQTANSNIKDAMAQLSEKDKYINGIRGQMTRKDSINLALALDLKKALAKEIQDEDIIVNVEKAVVYISISDKLLFRSGSSDVSPKAKLILEKVAKIIASKPEMEVMVEGNTDNVPISTARAKDNWDLSTQRATSVIRVLQNDFGVDPAKLIAAGRSEYKPIATNETAEGKSTNRRTRIVILPKLDQFFEILEKDPNVK